MNFFPKNVDFSLSGNHATTQTNICRGRGNFKRLLNGNFNDFGKKKGKLFSASPKKNLFRGPFSNQLDPESP